MIGWLQFFFEGYLPESPCPPGCRSLHHHTNCARPKYNNGSINSSSSSSSFGRGCEDYYVKSTYGDSAGDASDSYTPFAPIPLKINTPQRKLSIPFSDGKRSNSQCSISSPTGYPEDNYQYLRHHLTASEEDLREIDDLISVYSDKFSESESESIVFAPVKSPCHRSPIRQQCSYSDGELVPQAPQQHRPSQVADCVLAKCHCMSPRLLSVEDVLSCSPLQHAKKLTKEISTQCVFSDIVPPTEAPSTKVLRNMSPTDEDTLTKHPKKKKLSVTMTEYSISVMKKEPIPSPLSMRELKIDRTPSPPHDHEGLYMTVSGEDGSPVRNSSAQDIIHEEDDPDIFYVSSGEDESRRIKDLCQTSSGETILSSTNSYESSNSNLTWVSHNYDNLAPHKELSENSSCETHSLLSSTNSSEHVVNSASSNDVVNSASSNDTKIRESVESDEGTVCDRAEIKSDIAPCPSRPVDRNSKFTDLETHLTELSFFPPFVIDFFQFAAHPEDYLTDTQLNWYYEGEAKLMKRREERKRARNALIEETTRLEASNAAASGAPGERRLISVNREISSNVKTPKDVRQLLPDVETVDIPSDLLENPTVIRLAQQLKNSENLRNEVLVNCAKLENDRSALLYKVEDLKDQLEDQTELSAETKISLKAKCRDIEKLKMALSQATKDVDMLKCQVHQRETLLKEKAGIVITQLGDIMEVPLDSVDVDMLDNKIEKYSIIKVEDIEKENSALKEEINNLKEDLHSRVKYDATRTNSIDDQDLIDKRRELEKAVATYKTKLTIEEQDKIKLQGQISVLESQVKRYKGQVENLSTAEDEAQIEKRRIQREMRSVQDELQTSRDDYGILLKKLEKIQKINQNR